MTKRVLSIDPDAPEGEQLPEFVRNELDTRVSASIAAADINGQVVAAVAADETVTAAAAAATETAAAAAIDEALGPAITPAVTDVIIDLVNNDESDLRQFLDVRYALGGESFLIGNGVDTVYNIIHKSYEDALVELEIVATGEQVMADVVKTSNASKRITFRVAPASNSINVKVQPISTQIEISDTEAPTAPTGFALTAHAADSLSFSWNASTDNVGLTLYGVYRAAGHDADFADAALIGTNGLIRTFTDYGLHWNTPFSYWVVAVDVAGNVSAPSSRLNATTDSLPGLDPASHSKLLANFEVSPALANGAAIASWSPTAGAETSPLIQATSTSQPHVITNALNGFSVADFDGGDFMQVTANDWLFSKGVFYVVTKADLTNGTARNVMLVTTAGQATRTRALALSGGTATVLVANSANQVSAPALEAGKWYAIVAKFMGGTTGYKLWINEISDTPTAVSSAGAAVQTAAVTLQIGTNSTFFWDGQIAQLGALECDSAEISDAECADFCQYLMGKYAITA